MGLAIITFVIYRIVTVDILIIAICILLIASRCIAKDCSAVSVRHQRLARRADCNATTIATGGIAANVRVVYK